MTPFTNLTGLAGIALLIATTVMALIRAARIPRNYLAPLTVAIACIVCIPIPLGGLPPAAYLRGITGDLSITSVLLLALPLLKQLFGWQPFDNQDRWALHGLITLGALLLYPLVLGIGYVDPYRLGFANPWFLGTLLVVALAACYKRLPLIAFCIALAVLAWSIGWYESNNLWNYLLDPFVAVYAIGALVAQGVGGKWKRRPAALISASQSPRTNSGRF